MFPEVACISSESNCVVSPLATINAFKTGRYRWMGWCLWPLLKPLMQTPHTAYPWEFIFRVGYAKLETRSKFSFFTSPFVVKWVLYLVMTVLFMYFVWKSELGLFAILHCWVDTHAMAKHWDSEMDLICQPAPTWYRMVVQWGGTTKCVP